MKLNTGENEKIVFFHLILVDFVIAAQIAATYFFAPDLSYSESGWIGGSFLLSFLLSFVIFPDFSKILRDKREAKKFVKQGLTLVILGSLVGLMADVRDVLILGRVFIGLGLGALIWSQLGIIQRLDSREEKIFFLAIPAVFLLGLSVGPNLVNFLSGPNLSSLNVSNVLTIAISSLAAFNFSSTAEKFFQKIYARKKKLAILSVGILVNNFLIDYAFDYALYPFVIWKLGVFQGGIVMMFLSALTCYLSILFYDWTKKDWLGIETIKGIKQYDGNSLVGRFTSWILRKGELAVFLFISIKFDPFITTVYTRHGSHQFDGMSKRDWKNFFASVFVGNVYWTLVAFAGVSVAEYVWKVFF